LRDELKPKSQNETQNPKPPNLKLPKIQSCTQIHKTQNPKVLGGIWYWYMPRHSTNSIYREIKKNSVNDTLKRFLEKTKEL
jgi:hypothetical protein